MKKNKFFLSFAFIGYIFLNVLFAQQFTLSNQYVVNKFSLSPAYAGAGERVEVFGDYRQDWIGVTGAPQTKMVSVNGTIYKNMGLGANINSVQTGVFNTLSANLNYAYHLQFADVHFLSVGFAFGMLERRVDLSGKAAQADPILINNVDRNSIIPDAGFGIIYHTAKLYVGFSIPGILSTNDNGETYSYFPHYKGHIAYKHTLNKEWSIDPIAVISLIKNSSGLYEIAIPLIYQQKVWLTPIYKKESIAIGMGGNLLNNFVMNYAYEFSSKGIMGQSSGTHEITIGWKLAQKNKNQPAPDPKKPYYKWVN